MKIKEIKEILSTSSVSQETLLQLSQNKRVGVKNLLAAYYKAEKEKEILKEEYKKRTIYEEKCYKLGYNYICGIDEVGRGSLAGPLVVASVILKKDSYFPGLCDSKKLSSAKREELYKKIISEAVSYAIVELDNYEIEKYNIYSATKIAMKMAIKKLSVKPDFILVDAMPLDDLETPNFSIIKGDDKSVSIAAASVIAKVCRDNLMKEYAKKYSYYDFENNKGYGTKKHLEGLKNHGICDIHRRDFEPIKSMIRKRGLK
ncbi:ribonuclease HII [Gemella sp. zg-1178]|uniref:ribonuclease HII n=1 Tax=Gemella sp. zg-1178 TaxID=2840372 RepID=UPI001C04B648|nr:ribonuclease HII [Gemella sp. zg-1178]MBU0279051.1 ribonuclease HII [Gemella sp. zg-1178]